MADLLESASAKKKEVRSSGNLLRRRIVCFRFITFDGRY